MDGWWMPALGDVFDGRRIVLAGDVPAAWTEHVELLRTAGATDLMVVATSGHGAGAVPDLPTIVVEPPANLTFLERIHFGTRTLNDPPSHVLAALDEFDADHEALVVGTFLNPAAELGGRPFLAHRRPEWIALEDKVVVDAFWDRAGIDRAPSTVVDLADAAEASDGIDQGSGTVWASDAREGFSGGASGVRWVCDDSARRRAERDFAAVCDRVRVMPFLDGIPCSIHGIVLPDGVVALRPVEMVTLRRGNEFVYAGCATFWDPPAAIREQMRSIARRAGVQLAEEVDFRGTFTVDGVVTSEGFLPTELNPRFGAGIMTIARASGVPIVLLNDLIVAGRDIGLSAAEFERRLLLAADEHRGGGTWISGVTVAAPLTAKPVVAESSGEFRWAESDEVPTATIVAGGNFMRCRYGPAAIPTGPSTAPLAAAFWRFADSELATGIGPLIPATEM